MLSDQEKGVWPKGTRLLGGIYEVLPLNSHCLYAEGGVGIVQRVRHREWAMDLAVKSPKPTSIHSEQGKLSYERECQTWLDLSLHPNIVNCYLVCRINNIPRLFAELVTDGSLKDWITDGRLYQGDERTVLARILDLAIQFAWGLDHAHEQHLLHLDVKPGNVMISGNTAKVTDFGLARIAGNENRELKGEFCEGMTPAYCSPEQYQSFLLYQKSLYSTAEDGCDDTTLSDLSNVVLTRQSDIWSWALSFITMFFGKTPCKKGGQTAPQVFEAFIGVPPSSNHPVFPPVLYNLMRQCFEMRPENRPASMQFIADRLIDTYQECLGNPYSRRQPHFKGRTPEMLNNRAASLLDLNQKEEAMKLFEKALEINPWQSQILYNSLLLRWRDGKISDTSCIRHLEEILQNHKNDQDALYALACFHRERGNIEVASNYIQKAFDQTKDRDDLASFLRLTFALAKNSVKRTGGFRVYRETENDLFHWIFMDAESDFFLVRVEKEVWYLVSVSDGIIHLTFDKPVTHSDELLNYTVFSSDGKWTISFKDNTDTCFLTKRPEKDQKEVQKNLYCMKWGSGCIVTDEKLGRRYTAEGGEIYVWDLKTSKKIATFLGHDYVITGITVSADEKWLLSVAMDGEIRLWEVATGRCARTLRDGKANFNLQTSVICGLWIDPFHRSIFLMENTGHFHFWNIDLICNTPLKVRAPLMICHMTSSEELEAQYTKMQDYFNIAREKAKIGDFDASLQYLDRAKSLDEWKTFRTKERVALWLKGICRHLYRTDFETVTNMDKVEVDTLNISCWSSSSDTNIAISGGQDHIVRLWGFQKPESKVINPKYETPYLEAELVGHTDWVRSIDMTVDGLYAATGSWDKTLRIWNLQNRKEIRIIYDICNDVNQIKFASDGRSIVVVNKGGGICLLDAATGDVFRRWSSEQRGSILTTCFSRDGRYIVTGGSDKTIRIWKTNTGALVRKFEYGRSDITKVAISGDMCFLYAGNNDGDIAMFNLLSQESKPCYVFRAHTSGITALTLFIDGDHLASGSKDESIKIWNLREQTCIYHFDHIGTITDISVNFDGSYIFGVTNDAVIRRWGLFWNLTPRGYERSQVEMERMLRVLVGFYLQREDIEERKIGPQVYYGENYLDETNILIGKKICLEENNFSRIKYEMELRGYCLQRTMFLNQLIRICQSWPGYIKIE